MQDDKKEIQNYLFSEFARMDAKDMFRLTKDILSNSPRGKEELKRIVGEIIKELQKEDYEETYPDEATPEPEPDPQPSQPSQSVELDMDTILEKIFSQGMDSLSPAELKFLRNQSN